VLELYKKVRFFVIKSNMKLFITTSICILTSLLVKSQTVELVYSSSASGLSSAGGKVYFSTFDTVDQKYYPYVTKGTKGSEVKLSNCLCQSYQGAPAFIMTSTDAYFACDDSIHGIELWASKGTPASTRLVKDLTPGTASNIQWLGEGFGTGLGNKLIFGANTGTDFELWSSDGTTSGTSVLADLITGGTGQFYNSSPNMFHRVGDKVFFMAGKQAFSNLRYLYLTDGTAANTVRMNDLSFSNMAASSNPIIRGNAMAFGEYGTNNQTTLYVALPVYEPQNPYKYFSSVANALANTGMDLMNDTSILYTTFVLATGKNLVHLKYNQIDTLASNIYQLGILKGTGNKTFFIQYNQDFTSDLWVTDGTKSGTHFLTGLNRSTACMSSGSNAEPVVHKDKLYFMNCDSIHGTEIWVSDGTVAGTHFLAEGAIGSTPTQCDQLLVDGDYLYFNGNDENYHSGLWRIQIDTGNVNTSLQEATKQSEKIIYPNPADKFVYAANTEDTQIRIISLEGKLVYSKFLRRNEALNIEHLSNGIYYLDNGNKLSKLVILH